MPPKRARLETEVVPPLISSPAPPAPQPPRPADKEAAWCHMLETTHEDSATGQLCSGQVTRYKHTGPVPTAADLRLIRHFRKLRDEDEDRAIQLWDSWTAALEYYNEGRAHLNIFAEHTQDFESVWNETADEPIKFEDVRGWRKVSEKEFDEMGPVKLTYVPSWH